MSILWGSAREKELLFNGMHGRCRDTGSCYSLINTFWSLLEILIYWNSSAMINQGLRGLLNRGLFNSWQSNRVAHWQLTLVCHVVLCCLGPNQLCGSLRVRFVGIALLISQHLFFKDLPQIVVVAATPNLDLAFPEWHVVVIVKLVGPKHISNATCHQVVVVW